MGQSSRDTHHLLYNHLMRELAARLWLNFTPIRTGCQDLFAEQLKLILRSEKNRLADIEVLTERVVVLHGG